MAIEDLQTKGDLERFIAQRFPVNLGGVLRLLVEGQGGVAFGTDTVTFTAADASAELTVAHGLPSAPQCVLAMAKQPANARLSIQETTAADATNFYVKGFQSGGAVITTTQDFYWLAVG